MYFDLLLTYFVQRLLLVLLVVFFIDIFLIDIVILLVVLVFQDVTSQACRCIIVAW